MGEELNLSYHGTSHLPWTAQASVSKRGTPTKILKSRISDLRTIGNGPEFSETRALRGLGSRVKGENWGGGLWFHRLWRSALVRLGLAWLGLGFEGFGLRLSGQRRSLKKYSKLHARSGKLPSEALVCQGHIEGSLRPIDPKCLLQAFFRAEAEGS